MLACFAILLSFATRPTDYRDDVFRYTNEFRKTKNKTALVSDARLDKIAQRHSMEMAAGKKDFGHDGFDNRFAEVRKQFHNSCSSMSENVAYGATGGKEAVEMWKESSGHRENMLGDYTYIGIGVAPGSNGKLYYTQIFLR